ncbi:MAG: S41 family peptidase [Planctomycetes bacterium]|nr:S41 family peptidase [Planctomycetota bacterium]
MSRNFNSPRPVRLLAVLIVLVVVTLPLSAWDQNGAARDQKPLPIDAALRTATIEKVLKQLGDNYIFPDVAAKMQKAIRDRQAKKEYDTITTGQKLAQALTSHLQEVSKDKHVRVTCSTEKLPARQGDGKPSLREVEQYLATQQKHNAGFEKVERLPGNVGYLELRSFMDDEAAAEPAAAAMNFLAKTDALIIDLRRNAGGQPKTVALLCSYFFDEKPVHLNSVLWPKENRTDDFWTQPKLDGKRYLNKEVFILTSARTFSAAEEFAYNLQIQKKATIVGETTGGGAHPGGSLPAGEHFLVFVPTGRAINPITKSNWEGTGVQPDLEAPADKALEVAHKEAVRRLLTRINNDEIRRIIESDYDAAKDDNHAPIKEKKRRPPVIASVGK